MTRLVLGADTLCWHARLEAGEIELDGVVAEARRAGAEFVQLNLHHARALDDRALADLARRAEGEGLRLLASGDFLQGEGRERVAPGSIAPRSSAAPSCASLGLLPRRPRGAP